MAIKFYNERKFSSSSGSGGGGTGSDPNPQMYPPGEQQIPLEKIEQLAAAVQADKVMFILPFKRFDYLSKALNGWIFTLLQLIGTKANKGEVGTPGPKPTDAELTALIQKALPKFAVVRRARVALTMPAGMQEVTVTWKEAFASSDYTVIAMTESESGLIEVDSSATIVRNKTECVVRVKNLTVTQQTCFLCCIAVAD